MTTHKLIASTMCLLIVASANDGLAQDLKAVAADIGTVIVTDPRQQALESAEDIEVMGIIIHATVQKLYPSSSGRRLSGVGVNSGAGVEGMFGAGAMAGMGSQIGFSLTGPWFDSSLGATPTKKTQKRSVGRPLGLYLEGLGVVFQFEAPPVSRPPKPTVKPPKVICPFMSRPVWERTRMQLRGELKKLDCQKCHAPQKGVNNPRRGASGSVRSLGFYVGSDEGDFDAIDIRYFTALMIGHSRPTAPTKDQLVGRLLKVLAENGRHFRHLGKDERLTVAVTFRVPKPSSKAGGRGGRSRSNGMDDSDSFRPPRKRETGGSASGRRPAGGRGVGPGNATQSDKPAGAGASGRSSAGKQLDLQLSPEGLTFGLHFSDNSINISTMSNEELSGDLHMRQGRHEKAVAAYEKAIQEASEKDRTRPGYSTIWATKNHRLSKKIAQALIGAGQFKKAQTLLKKLSFAESKYKIMVKLKSASDEPKSVPLPARLYVSVTKAQLDAVAAGKISTADFQKQARVHYADPAAVRGVSMIILETVKAVVEIKGVILSRDGQTVEISIGSDDGLRRNHRLDILKGGKTVGEIEVVRVEANRATARVISISGEVKKGDVVRTTVK